MLRFEAGPPGQGESSVLHLRNLLTRWSTAIRIVAGGLLVRCVYLLMVAHRPLASDAASYNRMALLLLRHVAFIPFWPPGLPLYLSLLHSVAGGSDLVARCGMLLFYLGASVFIFRTARLLTGSITVGNLSLLLLALSPATISASVETTTELPTAMLLMIIASCLLRIEIGPGQETVGSQESGSYGETGSGGSVSCSSISLPGEMWLTGNGLLLAASVGCLCLFRPSSVVLLVVLPVYLRWRTRRLADGVTVLVLGVLMVATWIGYVHSRTGRYVEINTANSRNFYLGNNPDTPVYRTWWLGSHHEWEAARSKAGPGRLDPFATDPVAPAPSVPVPSVQDPVAQDAEFARLARSYILQHPALFVLRSFNRVCVFFAFDTYAGAYAIETYHFPLLPSYAALAIDAGFYLLIAAGSILYFFTLEERGYPVSILSRHRSSFSHTEPAPRSRAPATAILIVVALAYAFPYFFAFSHPKYHYPIEPILMVFSASFSASFMAALSSGSEAVPARLRRRRKALIVVMTIFALIQVEYLVICGRPRLLLHEGRTSPAIMLPAALLLK